MARLAKSYLLNFRRLNEERPVQIDAHYLRKATAYSCSQKPFSRKYELIVGKIWETNIEIMQVHQHEFENVEQYLHHRSPYLMVDKILAVEANEIVTQKHVTGNEYFIKGHFPGAPIFPGAMMQELTTQSAGILIAAKHNPMEDFNTEDPFHNEYALGVLVKVNQARFKGFARPGDSLIATVKLNERIGQAFDFSAAISVGEKVIMRNSFQLMNIKSTVLQGD